MVDLNVHVGSVQLNNPLIAASGTAGFGRELAAMYDLSAWGGISSKGVTRTPRIGNPTPRVAETASGMLNSVGLQNPGIEAFIRDEYPFMAASGTRVIVNVAGSSLEDYVESARLLNAVPIDAIELNLSCPNVRTGCMLIGSDPEQLKLVVQAVRAVTKHPIWAKLTPNVTSISRMAQAASDAGADAVVLINTLLGMAIDWRSRRPVLYNNTGGLSGPAIKPIALRMVQEVRQAVDLPIIGVGGIATADDVLEFMVAGASAVEIGTSVMITPSCCLRIRNELEHLLKREGLSSIRELTGTLRLWP